MAAPATLPAPAHLSVPAVPPPTPSGPRLPSSLPVTRQQVIRVLRELLPRRRWTHAELRHWLAEIQRRNACAKASHAKRRRLMLHKLSL